MKTCTQQQRLFSVALVLLCLTSAPSTAQDSCLPLPLFSGNPAIPMPMQPEHSNSLQASDSRVVADFDNDGAVDLLIGSGGSAPGPSRLVYFRAGSDWWDFDAPMLIDLPFAHPSPGHTWIIEVLAAGDFNEDGDIDVAVGEQEGTGGLAIQRIHIMLGNGDGTFANGVTCGPNTVIPVTLHVADIDGDGHLDIGYGTDEGPGVDTVGILWGTGTGAFPIFTQVYQSASPGIGGAGWIATADIDGDNDVDCIVDCPGVTAAILRNMGARSFAVEPVGGGNPTFAEMDGDNRPDLVHADGIQQLVGVQLNNGTGAFAPPVMYIVSADPSQTGIVSAPLPVDLDSDGRDEVAIVRGTNCVATQFRDQVLVFRNNGSGTLAEPPGLYRMNNSGSKPSLMPADFDNDGNPDIVAANTETTTLLHNDGLGWFLTNYGVPMGAVPLFCGQSAATTLKHLTPGDVNGDGRFDLVAVRDSIPMQECTVMMQDLAGAFTTITSVPLPEPRASALALDDFNQDGHLDLAVARQFGCTGENRVRVAMGNGDGTFGSWVLYQTVGFAILDLATADLNGDSWPDMVATTLYAPCGVPNGGVSVFMNNGNGSFAPAVNYSSAGTVSVAITDLNDDGHPDIGATTGVNGSLGVVILLNDGDGTYSLGPNTYKYLPSGHRKVAFADVDGDGMPDLLATGNETVAGSGGLSIALNNGDGTFAHASDLGVSRAYRDVPHATDFDGDGNADLAMSAPLGTCDIYLGNGDGTFDEVVSYPGSATQDVIVHDFDSDGRPDIGAPQGGSPDADSNSHIGFSILLNRMCQTPPPPACPADIDDSGGVSINDLLEVINNWGPCTSPPCAADIDDSGAVDINDLLEVINNWGPCPT